MVKKRLIPKLLIKHRPMGTAVRPVLVTTQSFDDARDVGDPTSQAKIYEAQLADELVVLNIDGTAIAGDDVMLGLIERLASETFMPLCVGGGVRNLEDFATLLNCGADKVSINSPALDTPDLIGAAAARYGGQCVVVSIDFRRADDGEFVVMRDHAAVPTGRGVVDWAREAVDRGAGELMLCDADRDGEGGGLNVDIGRAVADAVSVPVILSGGCGRAEHFVDGFQ
ncbi:MAG: imidazole glycerol phosphate synthase subunit HisF, partial [Gammaproteobacteria bacterium]